MQVSHNVFRYSIKSLSSSLFRSLVTPCVSLGLNTVQISSSVPRRSVVQIGRGESDVGQLRNVDHRRAVGPLSAAHIRPFSGSCNAVRSGSTRTGSFAEWACRPCAAVRSKMALPRSCAAVKFAVGQPVSIRAQRNRLDVSHQVAQFLGDVALRTVEDTFQCAARIRFPGPDCRRST